MADKAPAGVFNLSVQTAATSLNAPKITTSSQQTATANILYSYSTAMQPRNQRRDNTMIIAIDGPSGAGKTTSSKAVAARLGFDCLDTGAMYRCVAYEAVKQGIQLDDHDGLSRIAETIDISFTRNANGETRVVSNGADVTQAIRTEDIDRAVTPVSADPGVRHAMTNIQRRVGNSGDYVVEGRDIGTVVFPNADVKIFLTADLTARAHRRVRQNAERGTGSTDHATVEADLRRRDEADSTRADSPLRKASDAALLDSTDLTFDETVDEICRIASDQLAKTQGNATRTAERG